MTAPTMALAAVPLREVVLDALTDAYYARRAEIQGCRFCARNPAGVCADHEEDNAAALEYEEAHKQIEHGAADWAAYVSGEEGGTE